MLHLPKFNGYLQHYLTRYDFTNYIHSRFAGLLQNRLYSGKWDSLDVTQDFKFSYIRHSLAEYINGTNRWAYAGLNIFNGTSYAIRILILHLTEKTKSKSFKSKLNSKAARRVRLNKISTNFALVLRTMLKAIR